MKVLVTGATGTIGRALCKRLLDERLAATALTRKKEAAQRILPARTQIIEWDPAGIITSGKPHWADRCGDIDAVVNLAGEPIAAGRWTSNRKRRILNSRIDATKAVVEAIREQKIAPKTLINASATGYYSFHTDREFTENDGPGEGFLPGVCVLWEKEAAKLNQTEVRTVFLRTGIVLSANGGALRRMLPFFRLGLGGKIGGGRQWMSWIHIDDLVNIILFVLQNTFSGPVNAVSPQPVTNAEFTKILGDVLGKSAFLTVPGLALRLRFGEMACTLLESQKALPKRLLESNFEFTYPGMTAALENLLHPTPQ